MSAKLLKNGTLKTYEDFPHGMPTTEAATINADLLAFLRRDRADRTVAEASAIKARMEHFGSLAMADSYAALYAARAYDTFADAFGSAANTDAGRTLRRMIDYTVERRS